MSKFTSLLASITKPLRGLLCKENKWTWGPSQEKSFSDIKHCLVSSPVLALYDPNRETKINADASSFGIGGVLLQKQDEESGNQFLTCHVHSQKQKVDTVKLKKSVSPSHGCVKGPVITFLVNQLLVKRIINRWYLF